MTILVIGDANADLNAALVRFPYEGDDIAIETLGWGSGGSAANVAAGLALLGTPARLLARVGADPAAEVALRAARAAGADLSAVQRDPQQATGLCFAAVSPGGERTFFSFRGANVALAPPESTAALFADVIWVHIAGHALLEGAQRSTTLALLHAAAQQHIPISLDMCLPLIRAWRAELLALLPQLRILFTNEPELAALLPAPAPDLALLPQGEQIVALKRGPLGCALACAGQRVDVPAFAVPAIDTSGCGDAFVAGFLSSFTQRPAALRDAARLANALGALVATRPGAADALPDPAQLQALLATAAPAAPS